MGTDDPPANDSPDGCTAAQMVAPGEYVSVERSRTTRATWVIVPEGYEQIAPASLYVLSIAGFDGSSGELDLVRPTFAALDGVVIVTALDTGDRHFTALLEQVTEDFCVDAERIVTSSVWVPEAPMRLEPALTPPIEPQV